MPYVIFSSTQCNVWHTPTLLLQLRLDTGHETLLLGWATFGLLLLFDHYHPITAKDDNVVRLTGRHFIANIELTELIPNHRSVAMCATSRVYEKKPDDPSYTFIYGSNRIFIQPTVK